MTDFLVHLKDAGSSTLALAAYIIVALLWALRSWLAYRPQVKAKQILAMYKSDVERSRALAALLGTEPPRGLQRDAILAWTAMQISRQTRLLVVAAYVATLLTAVVIVGMALFRPSDSDAGKHPVLINSTVERPDNAKPPNSPK